MTTMMQFLEELALIATVPDTSAVRIKPAGEVADPLKRAHHLAARETRATPPGAPLALGVPR